jgi:chromosome segregation ATPase
MQNPATTDQILDFLQKFRNEFCDFKSEVNQRFDKIETRLDSIEMRLDKVETRLDRMDERFDKMDARFDGMDSRFDKMENQFETRMGRMEARQDEDRKVMLGLIFEVKAQLREQGKMIMENRKMIMDIWECRDKVTVRFNRKLYVVTASISTVVSTIVSTGVSLAIHSIQH